MSENEVPRHFLIHHGVFLLSWPHVGVYPIFRPAPGAADSHSGDAAQLDGKDATNALNLKGSAMPRNFDYHMLCWGETISFIGQTIRIETDGKFSKVVEW